MATPNLIIKDEQTAQNHARAAINAYCSRSDEKRIRPEPIPARKGRHLDVDAVLARSLARVVSE
jgi:hypothetical protein